MNAIDSCTVLLLNSMYNVLITITFCSMGKFLLKILTYACIFFLNFDSTFLATLKGDNLGDTINILGCFIIYVVLS